jgi:hypothetical protein
MSWSALGSWFDQSSVHALTVFDDGTGPALYAGGYFTNAGGAANYIVKWNGTSWSALGAGMDRTVTTLTVFDDGGGPALYAGGEFANAGGVAANRVAKWNGTSWSALGNGLGSWVETLTVFNDGAGSALYAGGGFKVSPAGDSFLAKWGGCTSTCPAGTQPYGTGTDGCHGTHTLGSNSCPTIGATGFQLHCDQAPASALGLCLVTNSQDLAGSDPYGLGVLFHADMQFATEVYGLDFLSDASGYAIAAVPIPNIPALAGRTFYAQSIWQWPTTNCVLSNSLNLSTSNGLAITILP